MRLPLSLGSSPVQRLPDHFAEVVETETTAFLAQCLDPEALSFPEMPPFGSWVLAQDQVSGNWIYGIVYAVNTRPIDTVHRTRALGLSLEELQQEQPQIFALLKTEFRAAIVGFQDANGTIRQYLPPRPPPVHQGVHRCTTAQIIDFSDRLDFIPTLLELSSAPVDSLIATVLRDGYQLRRADRAWLVDSSRKLSSFLREDYDRMRLILNQIHI